MTITVSSKGQVVIPKPVRQRQNIRAGDDFIVLELSNGDILLRHARKPSKRLAWHMKQLKGLNLERKRETVREANW